MSEPAAHGEGTLQIGLLMEAAHAHQKLAVSHLEKLQVHTDGLDAVVRDAIRHTLVDELQTIVHECDRAAQALRELPRAAQRRALAWNFGSLVLCAAIPSAIVQLTVPSRPTIAALRAERDELSRSVLDFERRAGRAELRECGTQRRLCVRVDRRVAAFGAQADYYVIGGY